VEIGEHPDVAKNKALEVFNREVIEYVSATI
jgi:hypothetical protein